MGIIPLWLETTSLAATSAVAGSTHSSVIIDNVLPSGRQALTTVLLELGLTRNDRVAVPEWSSHCVLSAVSRVATPIPMREVLEHRLNVSCVLVYEHWGWPFSTEKLNRFLEWIDVKGVVIDRVDTADLQPVACRKDCFEVWSLSKVLGLKMGGLAKNVTGKWVSRDDLREVAQQGYAQLDHVVLLKWWAEASLNNKAEWLKNYSSELCESVARVLKEIDLATAFRKEGEERRQRAMFLSDMLGEKDLALRLENGGAPGIYPCGLGYNRGLLSEWQKVMRREGVETRIYNFNYSDDPKRPKYAECLALPIHSGIGMNKLMSITKFLA